MALEQAFARQSSYVERNIALRSQVCISCELHIFMNVDPPGLEPGTSALQRRRSYQLSYGPSESLMLSTPFIFS